MVKNWPVWTMGEALPTTVIKALHDIRHYQRVQGFLLCSIINKYETDYCPC